MGTFSKSLASLGGYMAGDAKIVDYVRHNSRPYIFSASMTPASAASALAALRYLRKHPEIVDRLRSLGNYAREGLKSAGWRLSSLRLPSSPSHLRRINTLTKAKELYEAGVYVNSSLPPATPPDGCLLRTSYMASHTEALLDEAMDIIQKVMLG